MVGFCRIFAGYGWLQYYGRRYRMRRSRGLTRYEQWDIFLLLALFMVGLLCLAAIWRARGVPQMFAFATTPAAASKEAAYPSALVLGDPEPPVPSVPAVPPAETPALPAPIPSKPVTPRPAPRKAAAPAIEYKWYQGDKYRYLKTIRMRVTAYAPDPRCCWPYPGTTTASGLSVKTNRGKLVAADTRILPFHSLVSVPGYHGGEAVPVLDRGGAIKGSRLDVLMPTFAQAQQWGSRMVDVKVYVPVDDD